MKAPEKKEPSGTYACPVCGKVHKDDQYCPVVIKKLGSIKLENQSYIMGGIMLECLEQGVDFIQTLKEIVYFIENGTKSSGSKFFDADLFVSYFAATLDCSPSKFYKKMRELPERFSDILDEAEVTDSEISTDKNNNINSIELYLVGDSGSFWEMAQKHNHMTDLPSVTLYLLKEMDGRKPTYHIRLLYSFNDRCFHNERTHYGTISCELYAEKEGKLKKYFEDKYDDWTDIAKKISGTFHDAFEWVSKLEQGTKDGLLTWNTHDGTDSTYYFSNYGQTETEIRIAKETPQDEKRRGEHRVGFGDYICIRENDRKMYHYGSADEYYEFGGPIDEEEEITKEPMLRKLAATIDRWNIKQKERAFVKDCIRRVIRKSDILSVTYSFVCSQKGHNVIPYCGIVTVLTPQGEQIEERVYLGRCNSCGVYYIFRRDYQELCKKGKPICKVIDAATGKMLSDSNFAFNSSSVLSEMGYNVQAAANMTAAQRQEILRKAVEEKGVSVNEILNLLELQIRLHSDRKSYQSAVDKWKEDSDFVKSYGIGSGRLKRIDE